MNPERPRIKHADSLEGDKVIVTFTDGRVFVYTVEQLFSLKVDPLPMDEED